MQPGSRHSIFIRFSFDQNRQVRSVLLEWPDGMSHNIPSLLKRGRAVDGKVENNEAVIICYGLLTDIYYVRITYT